MATPTIRQVVSAAAEGASATVNTTSATAVDDVLVCFESNDFYTAAGLTAPTGTSGTWTLKATGDNGTNEAHVKIWTRPVTAGGAQTVTVAPSSDEEVFNSTYVLTGADTTTPNDGTAQGGNGAASTSHVAPSVSPTTTDALLLCGVQNRNSTTAYSPPSGMTEQTDLTDGSFARSSTASLVLSASGATGTKTFTAGASTAYASASIAIKGATGAADPGPAPYRWRPPGRRAPMGMLMPTPSWAGDAVQIAQQGGVCALGLSDTGGYETPSVLPTARVAVVTAQPARQRFAGGPAITPVRTPVPQVAYQGGVCALGLSDTGGYETPSVLPTSRTVVATGQPARQRLAGGTTVPVRTAQPPPGIAELGTAAVGLAATSAPAKIAVGVGNDALGLAATGTAKKVVACAGTTGLGLAATGTAAKKQAQAGAAALGLAATESGFIIRPVAGTCALGLAGAGAQRKVATEAGTAALGPAATGVQRKAGGPGGVAELGLAARGTPTKKVSSVGAGTAGLAATGMARKATPARGATTLGLSGDASTIFVLTFTPRAGTVADAAARYHVDIPVDRSDRVLTGTATDIATRIHAGTPT